MVPAGVKDLVTQRAPIIGGAFQYAETLSGLTNELLAGDGQAKRFIRDYLPKLLGPGLAFRKYRGAVETLCRRTSWLTSSNDSDKLFWERPMID